MGKINFIIGGCRSGKSRHALAIANEMFSENKIFIATCTPMDDEMKERVRRHKKDRDQTWETLEIPIDLPEAILKYNSDTDVILVDCLTLWISNLLLEKSEEKAIFNHILKLVETLESAKCHVILVSNEVGMGIVPENSISRFFRDMTGQANQKVAACSDRVIWMVAGIPVTIKDTSK